jgi:hypothetical protein
VSPAASSAAPWLPRSVYFMSHRLVRPVPQRTPERGPFVATALSLHQPLSLSLSLSSASVGLGSLFKICLLASNRNFFSGHHSGARQQEYPPPHIQKRRGHRCSPLPLKLLRRRGHRCSPLPLKLLRALAVPGHIEALEEPSPLVASLIGSMQPTSVFGGQLDQAFSLASLSLALIPFLFCRAAVPFMLLSLTCSSLALSFL